MKAEQLKTGDWFKREGDWRAWARLPGEKEIIEKIEAVPVQPLQPTAREKGAYIPASEKVTPHKGPRFITLLRNP